MTLVEWVVNSIILIGMCVFSCLAGSYARDYMQNPDTGTLVILAIVIVNCLAFGYNMHHALTIIKGRIQCQI